MIEWLVVDLGGVAARFQPQRRLDALSKLSGIVPEVIDQRLFASGFEAEAERGLHSPKDVMAHIEACLEGRATQAQIVEAWALAFEPDLEVLEAIASLRVRRALFTNNGPMIDACLAGPLREIASRFDEIMPSWQLRARKPDALAFEQAAARLDCAAQRLLLLDDSAANVESARSCGWRAVRVEGASDVVAAFELWPALLSS